MGGALAPEPGTEMQSNCTTQTTAQRHKLRCLSATRSVDATSQFVTRFLCHECSTLQLCSQAKLRRSHVSCSTFWANGGHVVPSKVPPQSNQTSWTRLKEQKLLQFWLKHFSIFSLIIFSTLLFSTFPLCSQSFFF